MHIANLKKTVKMEQGKEALCALSGSQGIYFAFGDRNSWNTAQKAVKGKGFVNRNVKSVVLQIYNLQNGEERFCE